MQEREVTIICPGDEVSLSKFVDPLIQWLKTELHIPIIIIQPGTTSGQQKISLLRFKMQYHKIQGAIEKYRHEFIQAKAKELDNLREIEITSVEVQMH